jgi:hypothetical protein
MNFAINYLPVLVSSIVFMIVGTLWYGPLFGKPWMKLVGMSQKSMSGAKGSMIRSMALVFVAALVTSYVLAVLLKSLLITTPSAALTLAFFVWLGFVATTMSHRIFFERSSVALYLINAFQSLVALLLGSLIIVMWPL